MMKMVQSMKWTEKKMIVGISKMIATNEYTIPLEVDYDGNLRIDLCRRGRL